MKNKISFNVTYMKLFIKTQSDLLNGIINQVTFPVCVCTAEQLMPV